MYKLPPSWPRQARNGGPFLHSAWGGRPAVAALKRYAGRHSMHDPGRGSSFESLFEKKAFSLQSCAYFLGLDVGLDVGVYGKIRVIQVWTCFCMAK